jgi:hypothetical protein
MSREDQPAHSQTTKSPIWQIEFLGDGNAIVRRTDDTEFLIPAGDVADFLRKEFPHS